MEELRANGRLEVEGELSLGRPKLWSRNRAAETSGTALQEARP